MVNLEKVKTPSEWIKMRAEIEASVCDVLDSLPKERAELQVKTIDEIQFPGYVRRRINYFVDDFERVTAWLFVPDGRDEVPAILCCHHETPSGKDEMAGIDGEPSLALALRYAEMGYVTLAPDCIAAGDRISSGLDPYNTKGFYKDHPKMSAMGKMLIDHMHGVDALCDVKRVDTARIGVVGHGFGGHNAIMLAAFDERIQTCVASCGFTRFGDDKEPERWARDQGCVLMPKLKAAIAERKFTFDWEHLLALAAPSPMLVIAALNDPVLSSPQSCEKAVRKARKVYGLLGASEVIECFTHRDGRRLAPEALEMADNWFERWL
ncbi:MAG: hypothetical protein QG656_124 [Candidatus Hydrogenedentes bacterium]|nr:hypothetical protein [Candidatus Hydrogenedentota bacterium]